MSPIGCGHGRSKITRVPTTDDVGRWPVGPEARQHPTNIYLISNDDKLITIHGNDHPTLGHGALLLEAQNCHFGEPS